MNDYKLGTPYSGRFFAPASDSHRTNAAASEWAARKDSDLRGFWPTSAVLVGAEIGPHDVQGHQLTHWWKLFASLQLLGTAQILKSIVTNPNASWQVKECVLDAFQQYIRNQNLFCFYDRDYDKLVPAFSSSNFQPKSHVCENGVFSPLGRGNWRSCWEGVIEGHEWAEKPWEAVSMDELAKVQADFAQKLNGKSVKVICHDMVLPAGALVCGSATEFDSIATHSCDLVNTDPPQASKLASKLAALLTSHLACQHVSQLTCPQASGPRYQGGKAWEPSSR